MPDAQWVGNNQKSESKLSDDTMGHHSQPSFGGGILIQKKSRLAFFFEKWKVDGNNIFLRVINYIQKKNMQAS